MAFSDWIKSLYNIDLHKGFTMTYYPIYSSTFAT